MGLVETCAGIFTAEMSNRASLALENTLFLTDKNFWNVSRQSPTSQTLALTFAGVAAFDVSGDTDDRQGVDAGQAKEEGEEAVHLGTQSTAAESRHIHPSFLPTASLTRSRRRIFPPMCPAGSGN